MHYIFKEMEGSIVFKEDKVLFNEVVTCFNSGAYRAAYIMTWLTIAESLKIKLKKMALRDHELQDFINRMENGELNSSIDKDLIEQSRTVGLIDEVEYLKILNIQQLRNKYAHPNNVSPHGDEVISALRIAVDAILSKRPLLRHGVVKKMIKSMREDYHYLDDDLDIIKSFSESLIPKIHEEIYPFVLQQTLKELELIFEDVLVQERYKKRLFVFINTFLEEINPNLKEEKWKIENIIEQYPVSSSALLINEKLYPLINDIVKDRVIGYSLEPIKENNIVEPKSFSIRKIYKLKELNLLTENQNTKLDNKINTISYNKLVEANINIDDCYIRIIDDLKSRDWNVQNPATRFLGTIREQWKSLDMNRQLEIGRNILQAAHGNSKGAIEIINEMRAEYFNDTESIVEGMFLETIVNERMEFRAKGYKYIEKIIQCILQLDFEKSRQIIENCINQIRKSNTDISNSIVLMEYYITKINSIEKKNYCEKVQALVNNLTNVLNEKVEDIKNKQEL